MSKQPRANLVAEHGAEFVRFFKYKRKNIEGRCNICTSKKRLTFDHVPPQGCGGGEAIEVATILSALSEGSPRRRTIIQDGLKYRTICRECNGILGTTYDRALSDFIHNLRRFINSQLIVPNLARITCRPNAIVRGLLGHLMAAKLDVEDSAFDLEVRECVLDPTKIIPENYRVHYWIHPHANTVVMRDSVILLLTAKHEGIFFQLIKFAPIAFMITTEASALAAPEFGFHRGLSVSDEADVTIDLRERRLEDWPEAPSDQHVVFLGAAGAGSAYGIPRKK